MAVAVRLRGRRIVNRGRMEGEAVPSGHAEGGGEGAKGKGGGEGVTGTGTGGGEGVTGTGGGEGVTGGAQPKMVWRRRHRWARRLVLVLVGYARGQHVKRRSSRPLLLLWPGVAFTYLSPWLGAGYVLGRVVAPLGPEDWDHQIDRLRKDLDKLEDAWRRATRRASQAR